MFRIPSRTSINLLLHLQIENGDIGDTEDLLETEETDPDRAKEDRTKKKKYLGRINYKVSWHSKFKSVFAEADSCTYGLW